MAQAQNKEELHCTNNAENFVECFARTVPIAKPALNLERSLVIHVCS